MSQPLQIAEWSTSFETADSRRHKQLAWVALPINFQGRGYQSLLDDFGNEAGAMYGTWIALVAFAAGCPDRGLLADSLGNPIPLSRISRVTGLPVEHFERLVEWATSDKIRWLIYSQNEGEAEASSGQPVANQPTTSQQPADERTTDKHNKHNKQGADVSAVCVSRKPPTVDQVQAYCNEASLTNVDAEGFVDHYQATGWKLKGGQTMKNWQAAARNWNRRQFDQKTKPTPAAPVDAEPPHLREKRLLEERRAKERQEAGAVA